MTAHHRISTRHPSRPLLSGKPLSALIPIRNDLPRPTTGTRTRQVSSGPSVRLRRPASSPETHAIGNRYVAQFQVERVGSAFRVDNDFGLAAGQHPKAVSIEHGAIVRREHDQVTVTGRIAGTNGNHVRRLPAGSRRDQRNVLDEPAGFGITLHDQARRHHRQMKLEHVRRSVDERTLPYRSSRPADAHEKLASRRRPGALHSKLIVARRYVAQIKE